MCRHLAYLGPRVALDALLFEPEHSLLRQATNPRFQTSTNDNPHGFGVGWYVDGAAAPERYRTAKPMWTDDAFAVRATNESAPAVLAAVRNASPGSVLDERNNAPFTSGPYLFSHNGVIAGYRATVQDPLRARISTDRRAAIEGDTDSETLFAFTLDRLDQGASLADALVDTVQLVRTLGDGHLNLLLTDGTMIAATAVGNSLFTLTDGAQRVVASEPYDGNQSWTPVDDCSVVIADADGVRVAPLSGRT
jgi:gamma-glutamyl hercynylcysteine S-oxide hydrolase